MFCIVNYDNDVCDVSLKIKVVAFPFFLDVDSRGALLIQRMLRMVPFIVQGASFKIFCFSILLLF